MEEMCQSEQADEPPDLLSLIGGMDTSTTVPLKERRGLWPDVPDSHWEDWQWQMTNRLRSFDQLRNLLNLTPQQSQRFQTLLKTFHYSITPYYLSLIDWNDPHDPIRLQCVPDLREMDFKIVGNSDPLEEEEDMQVPGLVHRYPDRVLVIVTGMCSMYCRHCTRKRIWHEGEYTLSRKELEMMASYIRKTPAVREVVISGGDPLIMNIGLLDWFIGELRSIPHVEVIRIGTRVPVVLPMKITEDLALMLKQHRPLWINTQFNHAREVTPEAAAACDRLLTAGIPVSNQSVLLRGINDSPQEMKNLCHALQRIMVRPYYMYQCDPVEGVEHFRTSIWKGIQIIESMRGHTGGLCIPSFVVDAPGGGGKIPIQPFYLLSAGDGEIMLRNYEGMIIRYFNPSGDVPAVNGNGRTKKKATGLFSDNRRQMRRHKKRITNINKTTDVQLIADIMPETRVELVRK